jgi:hypothetical protein
MNVNGRNGELEWWEFEERRRAFDARVRAQTLVHPGLWARPSRCARAGRRGWWRGPWTAMLGVLRMTRAAR